MTLRNSKQNKRKRNGSCVEGTNQVDGPALKNLRLSSSSTNGAEQAISSLFLDNPLASSSHPLNEANSSREQLSNSTYDSFTADPDQGPSRIAQGQGIQRAEAVASEDTPRAKHGSSKETTKVDECSESSVDSLYDHLSRWDGYRYELRDRDIRNSLHSVEQGTVQSSSNFTKV